MNKSDITKLKFVDDAFIWIDGPAGSGKTTLIERVLESNRSKRLGAVRLRKNKKLRWPKEVKAGNEETRRYHEAGAENTLLVEYPDNKRSSVAEYFFASDFRGALHNAICCEAELTDDQFPIDLNIFVLPALPDPTQILEVQQVKVDKEFMKARFLQALGHLAPAAKKISFSIEDNIDKFLEDSRDQWSAFSSNSIIKLAPGYEGLIIASKVIVNIRDENERANAQLLLDLIDALGEKPYSIERTFGYFWQPKRSLIIANFANPKDAELKKVIAAIRRKFMKR